MQHLVNCLLHDSRRMLMVTGMQSIDLHCFEGVLVLIVRVQMLNCCCLLAIVAG